VPDAVWDGWCFREDAQRDGAFEESRYDIHGLVHCLGDGHVRVVGQCLCFFLARVQEQCLYQEERRRERGCKSYGLHPTKHIFFQPLDPHILHITYSTYSRQCPY
jgi:hypothetical protein